MVRWWAAFFIAGLVSPPDSRTVFAAMVLAGGLVCGTVATAERLPWMRSKRFGCERFARALTSFTICFASAIVIWQAAGLDSMARERSGARPPGSGAWSRAAPAIQARPNGIRSLALTGARSRLLDTLDDGRLSRRARGLVGALILDDRSGLDFDLSETYSYVGITHFLALSGMHLGAIAIPLSGFLSRLIRSRRRRDIALLAILCLYSAIAGFPASLLRALFLSAAIIAYRFAGMHTDLIGSLIAGSCVCVAVDSSIAFDAGFQLSFAAVCGIAFIAAPLSRNIESRLPGGFRGTIVKAVLFPALLTCSVQFFTLPLVIGLFKRASFYSPVANVVVSLPFTALLYAGLLYVFIPLGPMRALLALGMNPLCRFLEAAPGILARGPHAALYRGDFHVDAYLCGAALSVWALQRRCPRKKMILVAGVACITFSFLAPGARVPGANEPGVSGLSPGAGSIPRVECRGGTYLGAGKGIIFLEDGFTSGDAYRFTRSLWAQGVRRAGVCVVAPSYLRRNHGVFYLLKRIRVDEVLCSRYLLLRETDLPARLGAHGANIRIVGAGDVLRDDRWRLEIIGPAFPPPRRGAVSGSDAVLVWRLISP